MIDKIQNLSSLSLTNGLDDVGSASSSTLAGGIATTPGQNTGMDFGSVMANMATDTMNSLKGAESMSFKAIQGNDSFYVVQKAFKFSPSREQVVTWTRYLRKIAVCDSRLPERRCPATAD